MHTVNFLTNLVENHLIFAYVFLLVGIIFEGEFIIICAGVLVYLGGLPLFSTFIFILCGGVGKTFLGYYIGTVVRKKWKDTAFVKYLERRVLYVMHRFSQRPFWSIFLSKFILGVNHVVIIFAGFKKIPLKTYLKAEFITTAIWAPGFLAIGYFFGYTAINVSREIWRFSLIALLLVVGFILFDKLVAWLYQLFQEFFDGIE